ncbi:MAG: hypothetical protein M0R18_15650, partial [Deltaproteobacteria bacterium]|nr:hypothetical protein [Deltaproteobacteria bacterium]
FSSLSSILVVFPLGISTLRKAFIPAVQHRSDQGKSDQLGPHKADSRPAKQNRGILSNVVDGGYPSN